MGQSQTKQDSCRIATRGLSKAGGAATLLRHAWATYAIASCIGGVFISNLAFGQVKAPTVVPVLLFNYSRASSPTLSRAKDEIDNLFRSSGIRFAWTDCPPRAAPRNPELCRNRFAPGEIRVRILERQVRNFLPDAEFGFAIHPVWANVFFEPIRRLVETEGDSESNVAVILGYLIAHELGHLLLGEGAHASGGIMQSRWGVPQIHQIIGRTMVFTPAQCKLMLRNARLRTDPSNALLAGTASNGTHKVGSD